MKKGVIAGFPGVGKTTLFNKQKELGLSIVDSDSSKFSWVIEDGLKKRNPEFPENYINHILDQLNVVDYVLVSTHKVVRDALQAHNIEYTLVYPDISNKFGYMYRYTERDSPLAFIELMDENWNPFIEELELESFPNKIKLTCERDTLETLFKTHKPGQSVSDNWSSVSFGDEYTVALKKDGTLWTWGTNDRGQ